MAKCILGAGPCVNYGKEVAKTTPACLMARAGLPGPRDNGDNSGMILASREDLQPQAFGQDLKMDEPPLPVPRR